MACGGDVVRRRVSVSPAIRAVLPVVLLGAPMWLANQGTFRLLVFGVLGLLITDLLTTYVMSRSITARAEFPTSIDLGAATAIHTELWWRSRGVMGAHFIDALHSEIHFGGPGAGSITSTSSRRGLITTCKLRVVTGGLFSMALGITDVEFSIDGSLAIVPTSLRDPSIASVIDQLASTDDEPELVGVRLYREGDRRADLHWPSIARTGETMVRERVPERREAQPVSIVVAGCDSERFEVGLRKGRFAMAYAEQCGLKPTLVVNTAEGAISAVDAQAVAKALACAVPGPPPGPTTSAAIIIDGDSLLGAAPVGDVLVGDTAP